MSSLPVIILVIGIFGSIFLVIGYIPQVIKVIKTKRTDGISLTFLISLNIACFLFVIYSILVMIFNRHNGIPTALPLCLANTIVGILGLVILIYKVKNIKKAKLYLIDEKTYCEKYVLNNL